MLASIVVFAMRDLYLQFFRSFKLYRQSIVDFVSFGFLVKFFLSLALLASLLENFENTFLPQHKTLLGITVIYFQQIFLVTFAAVVLINLEYGLVVGVSFALLSVVFRTQW